MKDVTSSAVGFSSQKDFVPPVPASFRLTWQT